MGGMMPRRDRPIFIAFLIAVLVLIAIGWGAALVLNRDSQNVLGESLAAFGIGCAGGLFAVSGKELAHIFGLKSRD